MKCNMQKQCGGCQYLDKDIASISKIKEEYDKLLEFMTTSENEIEKQRILRHETKNEF